MVCEVMQELRRQAANHQEHEFLPLIVLISGVLARVVPFLDGRGNRMN